MSTESPTLRRGKLGHDLEVASKSLSDGERVVFQVIDAHFDGTKPQVLKTFRSSDDITKGMETLPQHGSGTARILDITVHSDFVITGLRDTRGPETTRPARDFLIKFLQQRHARPLEERRIFRWLNDPLLVNDIGSISSQWSQSLNGENVNFYRLVNRTSLQQDPLDFDLHPRDSYLTCVQDTHDRLIVIIVNDVGSEQTFAVDKSPDEGIAFHNPRAIAGMLAGTGWTSMSDGSLDAFAKLLILDFFLASIYLQRVDHYGDLIYPRLAEKKALKISLAKNPHLQVPLGLFEPRLSAKSRDAFKEIGDAEGILRSVNNLVDSIEFVVKALEPNTATGTRQPPHKDFERRMQELQGLCKERRSNAGRALDRLVETNLLFDFFGVFVWLATSTVGVVYAIQLGLWLNSNGLGKLSRVFSGPFSVFSYGKRWRFGGGSGTAFEHLGSIAAWWVGLGFCVTLMVIFFVGMLQSAQDAWDTAWRLFAVYLSIGGGLLLSCAGTYGYLYYRKVRGR